MEAYQSKQRKNVQAIYIPKEEEKVTVNKGRFPPLEIGFSLSSISNHFMDDSYLQVQILLE